MMKTFLARRYHLLLLLAAILMTAATVVFLINQSSRLDLTLKAQTGTSGAATYTPEAFVDASSAFALLRKPPEWKPREDGASPYVSRPYLLKDGKLVDPLTGSEPLYPPVPNQWLIDHHLDYTDVNILDRDPLRKGFTVREEFEAGTDPNDPSQFPPLCGKLTYQESGIRKSSYLLEFLGEEEVTDDNGKTQKKIQVKPALPLPNPAKHNKPDTSTREVLKGETIPGAPFLKVVDLSVKKKIINETEYDISELILQNVLTGERYPLIKKNTSREYRRTPIEMIESVHFDYQLSGGAPESFTVERGKQFQLGSLDKTHTETYKLVDISNGGVLLEKDGKTFTVKPFSNPVPKAATAPNP
jgi:hypothetical protein